MKILNNVNKTLLSHIYNLILGGLFLSTNDLSPVTLCDERLGEPTANASLWLLAIYITRESDTSLSLTSPRAER